MKKWPATLALSALLALSQPALSADTVTDYSQWMTFYYVNKAPEQIPDCVSWLESSKMLELHPNGMLPTAAFLSEVFRANPERVAQWVSTPAASPQTRDVIERALWLSGNKDLLKTYTGGTLPDYASTQPPILATMAITNAGDLDMQWAAFFATGNEQYVHNIIGVMDENTRPVGDMTEDKILHAAARWSLGSNMRQHQAVLRIVESAYDQEQDMLLKSQLGRLMIENQFTAPN